MPRKVRAKPFQWRNSRQLRGVASQLIYALEHIEDGAYVRLDIKTGRNLLEICHQAIHTEVGHEPTKIELVEAAARLGPRLYGKEHNNDA